MNGFSTYDIVCACLVLNIIGIFILILVLIVEVVSLC
jgi:hypothetical protein